MLDSQALRAVRLVVDTGPARVRLEPPEGVRDDGRGRDPSDRREQRDRPLHRLARPGARLHDGRREIERLRAERARREGDAFDVRRFHDDVLRHGKLPAAHPRRRRAGTRLSRRAPPRPPIHPPSPEDPMTASPADPAADRAPPSTRSPTASGSRTSSSTRRRRPSTATSAGTTGSTTRRRPAAPPAAPSATRRSPSWRRSPSTDLPVEQRITHDMLRVVGELGNEADDLRMDLVGLVDHIDGPQSLLPQLVRFQAADTPERRERLLARLAAFGPFVDAHLELLDEALASGMTAPRIVAERAIAQTERLLAIPAESSPVVAGARLADGDDGRPRARRGRRPGRRRPGPGPVRRGAPRPLPRGDARRTRASGRRPTARSGTGWRSGPGRASTSTRRSSTRSASTSSPRSTSSGGRSPPRPASVPSPPTVPTS